MSKFEWKELPDWSNPDDYKFLDGAKPEVWAWEFLRRNPDYRSDWQKIDNLKSKHGRKWASLSEAHVCNPPKRKGETERRWMSRVVADVNGEYGGVDPVKVRLDVCFAEKWGLKKLYNPYKRHSQGVFFIKPDSDFPRMIVLAEEFERFIESGDQGNGIEFQKVMSNYAMIVFDITRPVDGQGKLAEDLLRKWKKKMLAAKLINKNEGHSNKVDVWLRHIRVLDARRTSPRVTSAALAKHLGGQKSISHKKSLQKEGETFIKLAKKMASSGYRKAIFYDGIPYQITP